ncbi:dual OB domain-containing protein [Streptomyces cyaneofuscatus]|uniref:dual OB domain-containing protein n=1 Tax=Streptomyces cyaneofuscatus TaxID=66883 RepID=UPI003EBEC66E
MHQIWGVHMALGKTLVCLANSRKLSGRCVAGMVDDGSGEWVRPVSSRPKREVSAYERQYKDGTDPNVLDIVVVPFLRHQPHDFQSENWLLDPDYYWKKTGRIGWSELLRLQQHPRALWINGSSSYHGNNDRILTEEAITLPDSLKLIRVTGLTIQVHVPGERFGDQRPVLRACFSHAGHEYILRVTDPDYELEYLPKPEGIYALGESFLTVSLGEPYEGYVYKLVAAIIERAKV